MEWHGYTDRYTDAYCISISTWSLPAWSEFQFQRIQRIQRKGWKATKSCEPNESCDASELFHLIRVNFFFRDRHVEVAQNHPFWRSERSLQQFMVLFDSESVIPAECSDFVTISLKKHNVTVGVLDHLRVTPAFFASVHLLSLGGRRKPRAAVGRSRAMTRRRDDMRRPANVTTRFHIFTSIIFQLRDFVTSSLRRHFVFRQSEDVTTCLPLVFQLARDNSRCRGSDSRLLRLSLAMFRSTVPWRCLARLWQTAVAVAHGCGKPRWNAFLTHSDLGRQWKCYESVLSMIHCDTPW